jgi:hypothetical protein
MRRRRVAVVPVGGAPLRSAFVENLHANGSDVYAHEQYVLVGPDADGLRGSTCRRCGPNPSFGRHR